MKRLAGLRERLSSFSFQDLSRPLVGAVAVVVTGAVVLGVFAIGSLGLLRSRYSMSGVFIDSGGLRNGDLVRVAGVDVGSVTGITPDFERGQVIVTWEVDSKVRLGPATTAQIAVTNLLGGVYMRLGGPVTSPYMADLPAAERRIPLERTRVPSTVNEVLNNATRAVQELNVANVNKLLDQLTDLSGDNRDNLAGLAQGLVAVSGAVNQRKEQVAQLLDNAQRITATLAGKDRQISLLVDRASVVLDELARRRDELSTLLGSGSDAVVRLSELVSTHRAQVRAILDDLHATLAVTDAHPDELNVMLALLGPTFAGFATSTRQGPWIDSVADGIPGLDLVSILQSAGP